MRCDAHSPRCVSLRGSSRPIGLLAYSSLEQRERITHTPDNITPPAPINGGIRIYEVGLITGAIQLRVGRV